MNKKVSYPQEIYVQTKHENSRTYLYAESTYDDYCERGQDAVVAVYCYKGLILIRNNTIIVPINEMPLERFAVKK